MISLQTAVTSFLARREGNFAVMTAAVSVAIVLAAGFALNIGQISMTRSNLLNALDAAITSTARDITTGRLAPDKARETVEAFLLANGGTGFAAANDISLDSLVANRGAHTLQAVASVDIELAFPVFGGSSSRKISVESAAVYSDKKIEVAMMLDITGSMAGNKLSDLKRAARNAVATLLASNSKTNPRVRVAIVPYANSVNVGHGIAQLSVFVEETKKQRSDILKAGRTPGNTEPKAVSAGHSRPDNCATERKGDYQYSDAGPDISMVNRDYFLDKFAGGVGGYGSTRTCPKAEIVPLTADAGDLLDAIDDFEAEGGTAGHIGIQWSWYMLSRSWRNVLPAASAPAPSDPTKVAKYAVLMTDGEFNLSYFDIDKADQAYNNAGKYETRDAATRLCRRMRDAGIEVFTIGFKLEDKRAKETMSACASPDNGRVRHHFETSSGAELDAAFQEIAANIERLALTK